MGPLHTSMPILILIRDWLGLVQALRTFVSHVLMQVVNNYVRDVVKDNRMISGTKAVVKGANMHGYPWKSLHMWIHICGSLATNPQSGTV